MLKDRSNTPVTDSAVAGPIAEVDGVAAAPHFVSGMAEAELLIAELYAKEVESVQRLTATKDAAVERVLAATPQKRVADMIEKAIASLPPNASPEERRCLEGHIRWFANAAVAPLMSGNVEELNRAINGFCDGVADVPKARPPKPALMPSGDNAFPGWPGEEVLALRNILSHGLCGVVPGDYCVSVDAKGARLASGRVLSRQEIAEQVQPVKFNQFAVGSLGSVMAAIRAR